MPSYVYFVKIQICKYISDVLTDVIRNCAYRRAVRDDVIIRQGDQGDRCVTFTLIVN